MPPIVSVIIPSFNHEKYVRECIQSVLNQTFEDFEIIVTDDASTDHTADIIEGLKDSRIQLFRHHKNLGVSLAANNCLLHASGRYVAWLSSDDAWYPEKLSVQVGYLEQHPNIAAVFGKVKWVDGSGDPVEDFEYSHVYDVENRTRHAWLRRFFVAGNCLSIPCSLVRRECYAQIGMFDPALAGIPDLDLWVRLCLRYDIMILDQELLRNRWLGSASNASGGTTNNNIRNRFEYRHILAHYLKIESPDELLLVFPEAARYGRVTAATVPYFLARVAISSGQDFKMLWGLDILYGLVQDETMAGLLEDTCAFSYNDFLLLARECDSFGLADRQMLAEQVDQKDRTIRDMRRGLAFRLLEQYRRLIELVLPLGSKRRRLYTLGIGALRVLLFEGPRSLLNKARHYDLVSTR